MNIVSYPEKESWPGLLQRPALNRTALEDKVKAIIVQVADRGDRAVMEYSLKFDGFEPESLEVPAEEIRQAGEKVNKSVRTMGLALSSCTPPAKGVPIFEIAEDEMEVGVGIHGEPGRRREKIKTADEIVKELFNSVFNDVFFSDHVY